VTYLIAVLAVLASLLVSPVYILALAMVWVEEYRNRLIVGLVAVFVVSVGWVPAGGALLGPGRADAPPPGPVSHSIIYPILGENSLNSSQRSALTREVREAAEEFGVRGGTLEMRRVERNGGIHVSRFEVDPEVASQASAAPEFLAQIKFDVLAQLRGQSSHEMPGNGNPLDFESVLASTGSSTRSGLERTK